MDIKQYNAMAKAYNERAASQKGNLPCHFNYLTEDQQNTLCEWITDNFRIYRKTVNRNHTTYYYKHIFEQYGFHISNGQFKGALLKCDFKTEPIREGVNWYVNFSEIDIKRLTKGRAIF